MSWPKTWADREDFEGHHLDLVECPCGRETHADVIVDLRGVGLTSRDWGCDACLSRMVREQGVQHSALMAELGAPQAEVDAYRVRERWQQLRRETSGEVFDSGQALERARLDVLEG